MSGALMMMRALTALHPGAGTSVGSIDLPIQREAVTNWPMIQSSSIKGVLRDTARWCVAEGDAPDDLKSANRHEAVVSVFGPPPKDHEEDAPGGALIVTDGRIFAFPVRSLQGIFALITCPETLKRLSEDCALARLAAPEDCCTLLPGSCDDPSTLFFDGGNGGKVALLEDLLVAYSQASNEAAKKLAEWRALTDVGAPVAGRLVVVSDDIFNYCVQYRTQIMTRNALDLATKTVEGGLLFTEELLPPETLMYSVLLAERDADDPIGKVEGWLADRVDCMQIGADSSTGKGICKVAISGGDSDAADA